MDQTDKKTEVILGLKFFLTVLIQYSYRIILILPFPKMYGGISCCINSKLLMQNNGKPQPNCDKASCINNSSKKVHTITRHLDFNQ